MKLLFVGNDSNLIKRLHADERIQVTGVVADPVDDMVKKYFGSAREFAMQHNLPVVSMRVFKNNPGRLISGIFKGCAIVFSQGYRYKVPKELIDAVPKGIVNFHQSMLPAYRGRHPLNWAIINNERSTGVTFHFMNRHFDGGRVIAQKKIKIAKSDTVMSLYKKTIEAGLSMLPLVIGKILVGERGVPQSGKASYYPARSPQDGLVPEDSLVKDAANLVRALVSPYPGAYILVHGRKIIIEQIKLSQLKKKNALKLDRLFWNDKKLFLRLSDGTVQIAKVRWDDSIVTPGLCQMRDI